MGSLQNILCLKISPNVISKETAAQMDRVVNKTSHFEMKQQGYSMGLLLLSSTNTRQHTADHDNTLL